MKKISYSVGKTLSVLFFIAFIASCSSEEVKIALSKGAGSPHYSRYGEWLGSVSSKVETVNMYEKSVEEAVAALEECSGLVLTGGPDVHPGYYRRPEDTSLCDIDGFRDTLEFALIKKALEMKLPILAICRGEQILNVALGGTLYADLPTQFDSSLAHRCADPSECYHAVFVEEDSYLRKLTRVSSYLVNTNHHQGVDSLAPQLKAVAKTQDSLVESYEWANPENMPFLIAVQWHPERLDEENPMSLPLAVSFFEAAKKYKEKRAKKKS